MKHELSPPSVGYFVLSLDTELAWGYFDRDRFVSKLFSPDGSRERRAVERLLDILDEFGIVATWGIVGHLFHHQCELCDVCPILDWQGKHLSFDAIYLTAEPLWYATDMVSRLLARKGRHEIAFHGYTHEIFDERSMSAERAQLEITRWFNTATHAGVIPQSVIFPRNIVGHLEIFKQAGFICFRGETQCTRPPPSCRPIHYGRALIKSIDHILGLSTPPVFDWDQLIEPSGLVNLLASQHLFGFNFRLDRLLEALNLHLLRINRITRAVRKAAAEGKIIHVWAHEWEFRSEKDFDKLRYLLASVAQEIDRGKMQSIGMADLARRIIYQQQQVAAK